MLTHLPSAYGEAKRGYVGPKTSTVLCPPKPNELEITAAGSHVRDSVTMSESGMSGSWVCIPVLGGMARRRMASTATAASIEPEAPRQCPVVPLIDEIGGWASPKTRLMTAPSVRSLRSVPVP